MGLTVQFEVDQSAARLRELLARLGGEELPQQAAESIAYAGRLRVQSHLREVDAKRSGTSMRGARSGYYAEAALLTFSEVEGDEARVAISQPGIALHYYGGTVRPKRAKALTIPATPEAYGKRASEFPGLELVVFGKGSRRGGGKGAAALVKKEEGRVSKVYYWLVNKTEHRADRTILPTEQELLDTAADTIERLIDRLERRADG